MIDQISLLKVKKNNESEKDIFGFSSFLTRINQQFNLINYSKYQIYWVMDKKERYLRIQRYIR